MADSVSVSNFPDSGSPARVAFDMVKYMSNLLPDTGDKDTRIKATLDLYADCYSAADGQRSTTDR